MATTSTEQRDFQVRSREESACCHGDRQVLPRRWWPQLDAPSHGEHVHHSSRPPSDSSKRPALSPPKKAHSSSGPHGASTPHLPASYRPAPSLPQPAQPNFDRSNSQRSVPKPPHSDTLIRADTTKDQRPPGPPASVKASARESPNSSTAGVTPRRREKKKEDKANDADIIKRLQQICTDADPTRLYRNLVKIGQG